MKYLKNMIIVILAVGLILGQSFVVSAVPTEDDEIVRTIDKINEIRQIYGLPDLNYNVSLNNTAKLHNSYMVFNQSYSSIEESGDLYYRGRYPWDRASYNGYKNAYVFELLSQNILNYSNGLNKLLENPYARYAIFDPLYVDLGMDTYKNYTTYLLGGSNRDYASVVVYPYNQQQQVSTYFDNVYVLDPFDSIEISEDKVGLPITLSVYSGIGEIKSFEEIEIEVIDTRTNKSLDYEVVTSLEDRNLTNSMMILPLEAYNYGTTYEISIEGTLYLDHLVTLKNGTATNRININHFSSFTTKDSNYSNNAVKYTTRSEFVEGLIKATSLKQVESLEPIFPDVSVTSSSYKYIYTAYKNKIVEGYDDGFYRPNVNINREQAYTIIMRTYEQEHGSIDNLYIELDFLDKDTISEYARNPIRKAIQVGILSNNVYKFNPKTYITQIEFEQMIKAYLSIVAVLKGK